MNAMNALDLIARSIEYNEIVTAEWSHILEADLSAEASGSVPMYQVCMGVERCEFWGEREPSDDENDEPEAWRVHLRHESAR